MNSPEQMLDHRARLERARLDAEERRSRAMVEQSSPGNSHETRVRAWEKLHQVRLPRDPEHNVLLIIARQTGMALTDVQEVQRLRAQPPAA
jgi:hypothetical protein